MKLLRRMRVLGRAVVGTVFPEGCWADEGACEAGAGLSEGVRMAIGRMGAERYCRACGLRTGPYTRNDLGFRCGRCEERDAGVVRIARVGRFEEPLVTLVHRLKFGRAWEVAGALAPFLYQAMVAVSEEQGVSVDVMVPVPLHWTRRAWRGFNQAEELARETGRLSGWGVRRPLRRVRRTAEQARLDAPTRRVENLRGAFWCQADEGLAGKHVWLVDDVSTTGATLHAAATAIRKLGRECRPASINAAVVCVADRGGGKWLSG